MKRTNENKMNPSYLWLKEAVGGGYISTTLTITDLSMNSVNHRRNLFPRAQLFEGRLPLNLGFFVFCSKAFSQIILYVIFRASNHQLVDKKNIKTEMLFRLSYLNSNLALTLGYLNLALNNSALTFIPCFKDLNCLPSILLLRDAIISFHRLLNFI